MDICAAARSASRDLDCQVTAWKIYYAFSSYPVFPIPETYFKFWNPCSYTEDHSATRVCHPPRFATGFRDSQGGNKTLDDEYFCSLALYLIFFICRVHAWNQSYRPQEYHSSPFPDEGFREAVQRFVNWLSEGDNKRRWGRILERFGLNKLGCIMFGAWIQ